jgi:hypothetical protein
MEIRSSHTGPCNIGRRQFQNLDYIKGDIRMEESELLKEAEAHLARAEGELRVAEDGERAAERQIHEALEEIKEAEKLKADEIVLEIATPKGLFEGIFREKSTVAAVIEVVVEKKNLDRKDTFELVHGDKVLQPTDRSLESFGLKCTAKLELVATGTGV